MISDRVSKRQGWRLGTTVLAAVLFAGACSSSGEGDAAVAIPTSASEEAATTTEAPAGTPVPVLDPARTVDGAQLDWNSLEGKDVVVWFWAPW
jgi:hypothetical protein